MPITDEEIISAVNQLGPLKTPGPDGIPAAFYQKFWVTVRQTSYTWSKLSSTQVLCLNLSVIPLLL